MRSLQDNCSWSDQRYVRYYPWGHHEERQGNVWPVGKQWKMGAKSPHQEKIIVFQSQIKYLKILNLSAQLINKLKQGQNNAKKSTYNQQQRIITNNQNQGSKNHRNPKNKSNWCFQWQDWEWVVPQKQSTKAKANGNKNVPLVYPSHEMSDTQHYKQDVS